MINFSRIILKISFLILLKSSNPSSSSICINFLFTHTLPKVPFQFTPLPSNEFPRFSPEQIMWTSLINIHHKHNEAWVNALFTKKWETLTFCFQLLFHSFIFLSVETLKSTHLVTLVLVLKLSRWKNFFIKVNSVVRRDEKMETETSHKGN